MASDTKFDRHLEEGLLPAAANEKGIPTTTSRSTRTPNKMTAARRVLLAVLVCGLMTVGLASAIGHRARPCTRDHREQVLVTEGEVQDPAKVALIHKLLHAYFPDRYQDGVYSSDKEAIAAFEADDAELASALGQLAKRQDNGTATTPSATATPSATEAAVTTSPSSAPPASNTPAPTPTPTPTPTPSPSPAPATSNTPAQQSPSVSAQESNTQQRSNPQSSQPAPNTPSTPATSAAAPTTPGTSLTEQAESPSSTVGPSSASTGSPPTTSGSPSSSPPPPPPSSAPSSAPTTASPGSSRASTQADTRQSSTVTRASPRTTSFSEVRSTFTSTASNGDLVLVTATSFVAVDPEPTAPGAAESGSSGGGGLQNTASPLGGASFALPLSFAAFLGGVMLLL